MAQKFLGCLQALIAVLFNRPLRVRFKRAGEAIFYPHARLVLPVMAGGAPEGDGDGDGGDGDGDGRADDGSGGGDGDGVSDEGGDGDGETKKTAEEYRRELRKTERRAKKSGERKDGEIADLKAKLKEREEEDQTEHEKAVKKAKEEGRTEALTEAQKERRKDRLESAITRAAGKKIEIGEGDNKKQVRFDDPEDAELYLQRKITKGDLDEADLFDGDGKVKTDAVAEALREILEEKPRLAEEAGAARPKIADGGADGGKGSGSGEGGETDMNALLRRPR
jgi:hypothetical protein